LSIELAARWMPCPSTYRSAAAKPSARAAGVGAPAARTPTAAVTTANGVSRSIQSPAGPAQRRQVMEEEDRRDEPEERVLERGGST
jgi:hypothetical protein